MPNVDTMKASKTGLQKGVVHLGSGAAHLPAEAKFHSNHLAKLPNLAKFIP